MTSPSWRVTAMERQPLVRRVNSKVYSSRSLIPGVADADTLPSPRIPSQRFHANIPWMLNTHAASPLASQAVSSHTRSGSSDNRPTIPQMRPRRK